MIIEKKTLSKLKDLGLNSYESKVWVALLSRGISTAGELSDIANVPRSRSYDVLESLEKKGFVIIKLGKQIKYIEFPQKEALDRVKQRIRDEATENEQMLEEIKESTVLSELNDLHSQGIEGQDPADMTGSIKGRSNIYDHIEYQLKTAKESVYIATTKEGFVRKSGKLYRQIKKAGKNGLSITIAAPLDNDTKKYQEKLSEFATLKNIPEPKTRFCIADNHKVTVLLTDDRTVHPSYDLAVWMHSAPLSQALLSTI